MYTEMCGITDISLLLTHSGYISAEIVGKQQNNGNGLELPAKYTFKGKQNHVKKLRKLLPVSSFCIGKLKSYTNI